MDAAPRRRSLRALALLVALVEAGCVSVLGLSNNEYADTHAAAQALCAQICKECATSGIPFGSLWTQTGSACEQASCEAFLEADLVMSKLPLSPLSPCFSATGCPATLRCLSSADVQFGTTTCGASVGEACLEACPRAPCEPWQCIAPLTCSAGICTGSQTALCE